MKTQESDQASEQPRPTIVLLVRHATNDWVKTGRLAGRTPGVHLNEQGAGEAQAVAQRLSTRKVHAVYSSPLERAAETAEPIAQAHDLVVKVAAGIGEVDFGEWTGQELKKLAEEKGWQLVQFRPSAMQFPGGETVRTMQNRAVDQVEALAAAHPAETVVLVSHADVIKSLVAHYLGLHLDLFQRIVISPASLSVLAFTPFGGRVISVNETGHLPVPHPDE